MKTNPVVGKFCAVERALSASHTFSGVEPRALTELAAQTLRGRRCSGIALCEQGAAASALFFITSGIVKVCRTSPGAELNIVGLFGPRECVGATSLEPNAVHAGSVYAVTDAVEFLQIPLSALREAANRDASVARALLRAAVSQNEVLASKLDVLGGGAVAQRLARLFLGLAERFGDELPTGTWVIPVPLARRELSSLVGSCTESVIRAVSAWQKQGVLRTNADGFELLAPALFEELAEPGIGARSERAAAQSA